MRPPTSNLLLSSRLTVTGRSAMTRPGDQSDDLGRNLSGYLLWCRSSAQEQGFAAFPPPLPPSILPAVSGYRRVTLEFDFTGGDWRPIHQYILRQLLRQGAQIRGRLTLTAEAASGLAQHFVDNQLPDTLRDVDPHGTLKKTSVLEDQSGIQGV